MRKGATVPDPGNKLVWLDMEMTGLDPEVHVPLQLAVIVTTPELAELASVEITIHQPESALEGMNAYVKKMHTDNGLVDAVRSSRTALVEADRRVAGIIGEWEEPGSSVLAGNTIHQDRRFLRVHFPETSGCLHYRMVDVSTIKELVRRWYGKDAVYQKPESGHTALADVRQSMEELGYYRREFFKPA